MMNRTISIAVLLGLAIAATSVAQDTSQKVTFSSPAASAKNLLAELSKATGVTFTVSPQTQGEILLVDVKDVPLSELMTNSCRASGPQLQHGGGRNCSGGGRCCTLED